MDILPNTDQSINFDHLHSLLDDLIIKYKSNSYISFRIGNYLENLLPITLENEAEQYKQREERKKQLTEYKDEFTNRFLTKNKYFYTMQTELFLHYDGLHFNIYSEDDIQHQILTTITQEQSLMVWKHKIKNNIMKQIKERSLFNAIPESETIQYVINKLYPEFFTTRNMAKYFLVIVGDCVLNKNNISQEIDNICKSNEQNIYIISHLAKDFIRELGNQCYTFFGISNAFANIKFKYYDHEYSSCRLLQLSSQFTPSKSIFNFNKNSLDLLCVAIHYSARYGSADNFINKCSEIKLVEHALYLQKNNLDNIVDTFLEKSLTNCPGSSIAYKNIIFLWKKFLDDRKIPNIVFYGQLKTLLKEKMTYDEASDCFLNITSVQLPIVSNFMKFWETTINEDTSEPEIEIDELSALFKSWLGKVNLNISDTILLELIRHFYPDIVIEDNKYILNLKCSLWNKRLDITNELELFKLSCHTPKSLYEIYEIYLSKQEIIKNKNKNKHGCIASKRYFEKIAIDFIGNHIDSDGLIMSSWWNLN